MDHPSFAFIPSEDVLNYIDQLPPPTSVPPPPPPLPISRLPEEIALPRPPPGSQSPAQQSPPRHAPSTPSSRVRIQSTHQQLAILAQLYSQRDEQMTVAEMCRRTRLTKPTVYRLLQRLRNGEDITQKRRLGRKPKYSPALLKSLSTELCFRNQSVREAAKMLARGTMESVSSDELPVVSKTSIQRYVTDEAIMTENDNAPFVRPVYSEG